MASIWNYLSPSDDDMAKVYGEKMEETFRYYKSFDQLKGVEELKENENSGEKLKKDLSD